MSSETLAATKESATDVLAALFLLTKGLTLSFVARRDRTDPDDISHPFLDVLAGDPLDALDEDREGRCRLRIRLGIRARQREEQRAFAPEQFGDQAQVSMFLAEAEILIKGDGAGDDEAHDEGGQRY